MYLCGREDRYSGCYLRGRFGHSEDHASYVGYKGSLTIVNNEAPSR